MGRRCASFGRKGLCSKRVEKMQVDGMRRETGRGKGKERKRRGMTSKALEEGLSL
jgi:hypothetical protein